MKIFILVLILIFSLQSFTKANDIRDFEIEGISIGDSALDYFSNNELKKSTDSQPQIEIYSKIFFNREWILYEAIQISYKNSDKNKIIVGIGGVIDFPNNINSCKSEMYKISSELTRLFPNAIKKDWGKYKMPTNQGHYFPITFDFKIYLEHGFMSRLNKETGITDNLKVSLFSADYSEYLKRQN